MKIGIVWEHGVSKWTMAPFEELLDKHDVTVFVGEKNKFSTEGVRIPQQALTRRGELRASALGHHMGSSPSTRTRSSSDHAVALRFMRKLILPFFPIGTGRTKFSTIFFNNDRFCGA